jgi:hypothetical protein
VSGQIVMMAVQKRKLGAVAVILPAMLLAASSAWADSSAKSTDGSLPGVRQQQPIASHDGVYPPEPEPTEQANNGTDFNIGDMKVSIHGYISYAVGFGKPMPGKGYRR